MRSYLELSFGGHRKALLVTVHRWQSLDSAAKLNKEHLVVEARLVE